ncbi:hypothetical protein PF005_g33596 [Phytophthora fragariae]|uniref:Uncharacterized protein n=1 Tax=Phytophthora fragariae TaxID=53985 RepID=A0A6A3U8E8_9STRA|nr:hypothetical protein PF005_g33596 [Phytophthora fragariae]
MPMALLSPQAYGVPPSTPAPTPAEAETQTPEYQPAESDGNEENVESDGNVENVESDGNDEKEESDGNDENAESDGNMKWRASSRRSLFPAVKLRILKLKAEIADKDTS